MPQWREPQSIVPISPVDLEGGPGKAYASVQSLIVFKTCGHEEVQDIDYLEVDGNVRPAVASRELVCHKCLGTLKGQRLKETAQRAKVSTEVYAVVASCGVVLLWLLLLAIKGCLNG